MFLKRSSFTHIQNIAEFHYLHLFSAYIYVMFCIQACDEKIQTVANIKSKIWYHVQIR